MLVLTSPDFAEGQTIPRRFTCEGENLSPAFAWTGVPAGTAELMLACIDPDAPRGDFHHWLAHGIPADRDGLPGGFGAGTPVAGVGQGVNDFGLPGYGGPCPPRGDPPHRYRFRLAALSRPLGEVAAGARCAEILRLAAPLEIAAAELVGLYARAAASRKE